MRHRTDRTHGPIGGCGINRVRPGDLIGQADLIRLTSPNRILGSLDQPPILRLGMPTGLRDDVVMTVVRRRVIVLVRRVVESRLTAVRGQRDDNTRDRLQPALLLVALALGMQCDGVGGASRVIDHHRSIGEEQPGIRSR